MNAILWLLSLLMVLILMRGSKKPEQYEKMGLTKKTAIKIFISLAVVFTIAAFITMDEEKPDKTLVDGDLNQISVESNAGMVIDGKQQIKTIIRNNSPFKFSGNLSVKVISLNGDHHGSDMIFVKDLEPGKGTWADFWAKPSQAPIIKIDWSNTQFRENIL